MPYISLATEDELSEAVGLKLIACFMPDFEVSQLLRKGGFGYLRSRIRPFCEMARSEPLLLLTDLDANVCAPTLRSSWLGSNPAPDNFLFRVAVREIEAWLIADTVALKKLLGGRVRVTQNPDCIPNPKEFLLSLAASAPRAVKNDLLPMKGAVASKGLGYNRRLCGHVRTDWDPSRAAQSSASLARTINALRKLNERFSN